MELNKDELLEKISETKELLETTLKQAESRYQPDVADAFRELADLQMAAGQYAEAEANYDEAKYIYWTIGGDRYARWNVHKYLPIAANMLDKIAEIQILTNRHLEAEDSYIKAVGLWQEIEKDFPYLPETAGALIKLADLQSEKNNFENAEVNYSKALEIFRKKAEKNPDKYLPEAAKTLRNLAELFAKIGRHAESEACSREAEELGK